MKTLNRRIYADKSTGIILVNTGEPRVMEGFDRPSIESDFESFTALQGRDPQSVIVIELEIGQYSEEFNTQILGRVNPDTLTLEFSYPDPSDPEPEVPVYQKPLSEQMKDLDMKMEEKDRENKTALFEIYSMLLGGE
ncbi:hypothetical protein ACP8HI_04550 [Paenibacillus sp. FA6]|uniref:hypothetical protein n=1 Tax=Paenibacillus sp. FA6 TaxID=3413029 RepID=UPI003F658D59